MSKLGTHSSRSVTKMIIVGDNGSAKTGALASLAEAGYSVRILDLDNGVDVLADLLAKKPEALKNVEYQTLTDKMKNVNGKLIPAKASVWQRAVGFLNDWKPTAADPDAATLGPISSWTPKDVLVIDSLTMLSTAAMNFILSMNARLGQKPYQSDYGDAQQLIESLMQMLYDDGVNCNIVINTHLTYIGDDNGPQRGYPSCVGKQLPQKIGRYVNNIVMARSQGSGAGVRRKILTNSQPMVELKTSAPTRVKPEYPIETGLLDLFKDLQGQGASV
jgi:hypothetical protein